MQKEETQLTKEMLHSLVDQYSPRFAEHGIKIQLWAQSYRKRIIHSIQNDHKIRRRRFAHDVKFIVTQDIDDEEENALLNLEYYRVPCIVIYFLPIGLVSDVNQYRQYSFPLRTQNSFGIQRVAPKKVMRAIERVLKRNLATLQRCSESEEFCRNTIADYFRYAYRHYGYMEKINGRNRDVLQMFFALPLILLFTVLCIYFCL